MPEPERADNSNHNQNHNKDKENELKESFSLTLTNEEGMLLLTSARLLDKLVAGVTIHAQERDQLIKDIIAKLDNQVPPEVSRVAGELADAIVESVLCEGELDDDYGFLSEEVDLGSLEVETGKKEKFLRDMASDPAHFDYPMYCTDKTLPVLEKALINHNSVQVHYYSFMREAVDTVTLDPLVIMKEHSLWRMVAYCHEKRDILVFRVDRIKEIAQTKTSFEAPVDVSNLSYNRLPAYS